VAGSGTSAAGVGAGLAAGVMRTVLFASVCAGFTGLCAQFAKGGTER